MANREIRYQQPAPFVVPTVFANPATFLPRETLFYSAGVLEEIMVEIDAELVSRGLPKRRWRRYRAGTDDYEIFSPSKSGENVARIALRFFPALVNDIQQAIQALVSDPKYPDSLDSLFSRIFGDNTTAHQKGYWTSKTRIRDGYVVPATNAAGKQTLNPLANILAGSWAFPVASGAYRGEGHVENPLCRLGVGLDGQKFIAIGPGSIETSAPDFPESVIGKRRSESDVAILNGQLVPKPGATLEGVDGIQLPMRSEGRPESNRRNIENTSTGFGKGQADPDAGYTFLGHHPLVIQQLRYEPITIERFDGPDKIPERHYTPSIYSNTFINLPFIFENPQERKWRFRWGNWLVRGHAKSDSTGLTLNASPDRFAGQIPTVCPFSVFYPPSSVRCSCQAADTSYAVWSSSDDVLLWENTFIGQDGGENSKAKRVGSKTRLRVKYSLQAVPGTPNSRYYYAIVARINLIAGVNDQPFIPLFVAPGSILPDGLNQAGANYKGVQSLSVEKHGDGSVSVNIMDAVKQSYPQLSSFDSCFLLAVAIFVFQSVSGEKTCNVIDTQGGSVIDPSCPPGLTCQMGTIASKTEYLLLFEPPLSGADDVRLP